MRKYLLLLAAGALFSFVSAQQPYTLQRCLEEGLEKNYLIRISKNEQQIADNNATAAHAGRLPTVGLATGYTGELTDTRNKNRDATIGNERGAYNQTLSAGLDVGWTLFDGFRIQTNAKRLDELKTLGAVNTRITIEDFIATLTAEYYNYVQQKIRLNPTLPLIDCSFLFYK